jgi:hypothetical protein
MSWSGVTFQGNVAPLGLWARRWTIEREPGEARDRTGLNHALTIRLDPQDVAPPEASSMGKLRENVEIVLFWLLLSACAAAPWLLLFHRGTE